MTTPRIRVSREWLALREPADAAARANDLVERLTRQLPATGRYTGPRSGKASSPRVIHDLGCGTGAMARWLAPMLPGPQHWILHDLDADLLDVAASEPPGPAADGGAVTLETRTSDISRLMAADLAGSTLTTASALLDILTEEELCALITVSVGAGCLVLLTLSVAGRVELTPVEPLDRRISVAFDVHQRRVTERGRLLGPDAVAVAVEQAARLGAEVHVAPSPWRLGTSEAELAAEWFTGWVGAACEQEVELAAEVVPYTRRRLAQAAAGELRVVVDHTDLLISPRR
jgi:hypothetical protein